MTPAITMEGLGKRYGAVSALDGLTLDVPSGSVFGFLGPNGAGKSTTLKILAGLTHASSGSATIDGSTVDVQGAHRARVGYLGQEPRFYGWMTGRRTLEYVSSFYPASHGGRRIDQLLELVGLSDAADRPTRGYSGGMRQRLGIAQALAGDPPVLLLDEPAAALDPIGRHDVLELLGRLKGEKTVFYSTHLLDDVQRVSDHVAILDRGRLVVTASTGALMHRAASGRIRVVLLGADDSTTDGLARLPGVGGAVLLERRGRESHYDLTVDDSMTDTVQRGVMRLAVERDLVVAANQPETADLESVFLRIVNEERAA
jgi:ABC-2 type transport system ATP-binding protein